MKLLDIQAHCFGLLAYGSAHLEGVKIIHNRPSSSLLQKQDTIKANVKSFDSIDKVMELICAAGKALGELPYETDGMWPKRLGYTSKAQRWVEKYTREFEQEQARSATV